MDHMTSNDIIDFLVDIHVEDAGYHATQIIQIYGPEPSAKLVLRYVLGMMMKEINGLKGD